MSDNIGYTPGTGASVAADNIGGTLWQRVKVTFGVDGVATDVSAADPLPVVGPLTDAQLRAAAVPVSGPLTDAQLRASAVAVSGPLTDAQIRATALPVSAASLPLPAGAATETTLAAVNTKTPALGQALMAASVPVAIASNQSAVAVSGTVALGAAVTRVGFVAASGVWYDDSSTVLAAAATFTGTARDATLTATATTFASSTTFAQEVRIAAESDQSGTLWLEISRDNTTWRRLRSVATTAVTGGGQAAEIIYRPSWRYWRCGFTNGATLQTRFTIGSLALAI